MKMKFFMSVTILYITSTRTCTKDLDSGFDPDVIVAIGSGGFIPARKSRPLLIAHLRCRYKLLWC